MSVDMVLLLIAKFRAFAVFFIFLSKKSKIFQKMTCILKNMWYNMGIGTEMPKLLKNCETRKSPSSDQETTNL